MTTHIPAAVRQAIRQRARLSCEYCRIPEAATFVGCQVDHVIAEKHGGQTVLDNLALSCVFCNRFKGTDIASLDASGRIVRLYNPRADLWSDHFEVTGVIIQPRSSIAEATVALLRMNIPDRLLERELISEACGLWFDG